jgi:catechol 2,3-dioxygenase-like lactoylglutathione lyase family enzyme
VRRALWSGWQQSLPGMVLIAFLVTFAPLVAEAAPATRPSSGSIRTPDFDESLRWYQDKLNFRLISEKSFVPGRTAVLERGGFLIEITETDHAAAQPQDPAATGAIEVTRAPVVSLLVPDVDQEVARLQDAGVDILQTPEDELEGHYRIAQIRDNGRHRIELREPLGSTSTFNLEGR